MSNPPFDPSARDPWTTHVWSGFPSPGGRPAASAPWSTRLWPADLPAAARPAVLGAALAVGALGALTLGSDVTGAATLLTGLGVVAVAYVGRGRRPRAAELVPLGLVAALLGVGTLRDAPWLVAVSLLGAWALATLTVVGARTWTGVVAAPFASWLAPGRAARWVLRTVGALGLPRPASWRGWLVVAGVSCGLLGLFGALFAAADPAYAALLDDAASAWDVGGLAGRTVNFAFVTVAALVAAFLGFRPPVTDALAPAAGRPVRRWSWAVPLVLLDLLFATFVVVQLAVLFGGREHVLRTRGLTYAEYARQGFWQLLVVTVLTLAVVAAAVRIGPRATAGGRVLMRALLGLLCCLALVVVASAIHRMSLYSHEFGFTRLRLAVTTVELCLGAVFVLLLAAGIRLRGSWLPRAVVGVASVAVLSLAAVNPDAYIAEHNVTRYQETGRVDVAYLSVLSADAVPALLRLPDGLRGCALARLAPALRAGSDPWYDANLSRSRARRLLVDAPPGPCRPAPAVSGAVAVAEPAAARPSPRPAASPR